MIGRKSQRISENVEVEPKGYDDFEVRLGDLMRGERATMGRSLLDVQRELRIRASYVAAIENCDPSAFETPGFIAGYVRSYARYLGMDAEEAFAKFCQESGFSTAHGMSEKASTIRKAETSVVSSGERDPFLSPNMPFTPKPESIVSRIEPQAILSSVVLMVLIAAIGYGGWSVLQEVQRVQLAPVEQAPDVLSGLDPLSDVTAPVQVPEDVVPSNALDFAGAGVFAPPAVEVLDRGYRPQSLDVPVLVARDAPISTLNPEQVGSFAYAMEHPSQLLAGATTPDVAGVAVPQVTEDPAPEVVLMAVRPAWVRISGADGSVIFEKILDAGEEFVLPATEEPPLLRAGMSGSLYFKLNGEIYGPAGEGTSTVRDVAMDLDSLQSGFDVADLTGDAALAKIVAVAEAPVLDTPDAD